MSSVEADTAPPAPDALMLARQALNEEARRGTLRHVDLAIITDQHSNFRAREELEVSSAAVIIGAVSYSRFSATYTVFARFSRSSAFAARLAAASRRGRGTHSAIAAFFASHAATH